MTVRTNETPFYLNTKKGIEEIVKNAIDRTREEEREEMFKILIESMPRDAENLSSLTGEQARETIQNFLDKLNN